MDWTYWWREAYTKQLWHTMDWPCPCRRDANGDRY